MSEAVTIKINNINNERPKDSAKNEKKNDSKILQTHENLYKTKQWLEFEKFEVCNIAAANGWLDLLQWARDFEFPWSEKTCSTAAEFGHLNILKWLRENGCPW